jgi:hypothetical protein
MKAYGWVDVWIHIFLTSALVVGEWSASRPCRFTPGEIASGTHWIGGWVDPRTGLDDVEKRKFLTVPGLELRLLCHPARTQSLYWLRYPDTFGMEYRCVNTEIGYLGRYSDEAVGSKTEELGVHSWRGQHISLFFSHRPNPSLGPTQPSVCTEVSFPGAVAGPWI